MIGRTMLVWALAWTFLSLPHAVCGTEPVRDVSWFLRRLRTVDHLAELEASHTAMSSTWDREGGNRDGTDFKDLRVQGPGQPARNVLLDVSGPGCIHRIFLGRVGEAQANTRIQFFLDHNDTPVIDMPVVKFFNDADGPIPYPLVFYKSYPGTLFPIPFEKHCLVQIVNDEYGKPSWKDGAWSNYWQITYTQYTEGKVRSLNWPLDQHAQKELQATCEAWLRAESQPPADPPAWTVDKKFVLEPGQSATVDLGGAGVVRQWRCTVTPPTPEVLSNVRLRIAWDKAAVHSVDVPLGYFFGHAHWALTEQLLSHAVVLGKRPSESWFEQSLYTWHFNSLLLGASDKEAYCRFPMPFADGAKWTFENTSTQTVRELRVRLDVQESGEVRDNWGRFHATWKQAPAATKQTPRFGPKKIPGQVLLDRQARGKYVGTLVSVDWPHLDWWGEGDWLIWSDQDGWPPDYHGTGSEEYFNSGWGKFDRKAVSGFVTLRPNHPTVYSFHLNDAFQFQRSIRVVEEQMGHRNGVDLIRRTHPLWSSTAFWYALPAQASGSDNSSSSHGEKK